MQGTIKNRANCQWAVRILLHPLIGSVHRSEAVSLYPRKKTLPSNIMSNLSRPNKTSHLALHNGLMPINDATVRCGTLCPVKTVGKPGMVMSQTCVDIICHLPGMLIFKGLAMRHLLRTSTPSMIKMEVAPMSAIA
jgi:hypothetical protein